jgi:predicted metal-binding protein
MTEETSDADRRRKEAKLVEYRLLALESALRFRKSPDHEVQVMIVSADEICFDEFQGLSVQEICRTRCFIYGRSAYCRDLIPAEEVQRRLRQAGDALLIVVKVPTAEVAGQDWMKPAFSGKGKRLVSRILRAVELRARADGYRETWGLGSGPCKNYWCGPKACSLLEPGGRCRYPQLAHRAIESGGINVVETVRRQGFEMYFIGRGMADPGLIPYGLCVGLVAIG